MNWVKTDLFSVFVTDELDNKVAKLVIVPRICLKHQCEEYSTMGLSESERHLSNLPKIAKNRGLNWNKPLAVSFVDADDSNDSFLIESE